VRSGGSGGLETSVAECNDASGPTIVEYHSPWGVPAWTQLASTGAAAMAHPTWSPDNHDFVNFTFSSTTVIGNNLN
jgi:hypothetical protein